MAILRSRAVVIEIDIEHANRAVGGHRNLRISRMMCAIGDTSRGPGHALIRGPCDEDLAEAAVAANVGSVDVAVTRIGCDPRVAGTCAGYEASTRRIAKLVGEERLYCRCAMNGDPGRANPSPCRAAIVGPH